MRGFVRIIAGCWRGRRLAVPDEVNLRPTPDRVRETLFNWLQAKIHGARCLDAFAGSGALGFEAVSRGAGQVVMLDNNPAIVNHLNALKQTLNAEQVHILCASVPQGLSKIIKPFDIVFLDPPYQSDLLLPTCFYLEQEGYLAPGALIYLEADKEIEARDLPGNWQLQKVKKASSVYYHLAQRS